MPEMHGDPIVFNDFQGPLPACKNAAQWAAHTRYFHVIWNLLVTVLGIPVASATCPYTNAPRAAAVALAGASGRIAVVGDVDQAIFGFRGADPDIMQTQFAAEFARARDDLHVRRRTAETPVATPSGAGPVVPEVVTRASATAEAASGGRLSHWSRRT